MDEPRDLGAVPEDIRSVLQEMLAAGWWVYQWSREPGGTPEYVAATRLYYDGTCDVAIWSAPFMSGVYRAVPCLDPFVPAGVTRYELSKPARAFREALEWPPYVDRNQEPEVMPPLPGLGLAARRRMRLAQRVYIGANHNPPVECPPPIPS